MKELLNEELVRLRSLMSLQENDKDSKAKEETNFTPEQKAEIEKFVANYKGDFKDEDIHTLAEKMGLDIPEVEEYIYGLARTKETSAKPLNKKSTKKGFHTNIEKDTLNNTNFRKVLYTGEHTQLVLMTLKAGEEIGMEIHPDIDQFFRFEAGSGQCIINGNKYNVTNGDCIIIPSGSQHNVVNTGKEPLKMYTLYSPPHHKDGVVFATKATASKSKEEFDGQTTE